MADGDGSSGDAGSEGRIVALTVALAARDAKISELLEQVSRLVTQVEQLTEKLNQNSSNSHLPPSSDGPGSSPRGGGKEKPRSGRSRGGQKGHKGSRRELLPNESVDLFVDLFPEVCLECAAELRQEPDAEALRYQQLDLRDHRPHLTEYRRHEVMCSRCGARTRAPYDSARIPAFAFGACLTSVVGMLTGVYHLSRRRAQRLLQELFGISVSLGALSAMESRASEALKTAYEEAKREVERAAVKHTDATSWLCDGKLRSLWTLASTAATVYSIFVDGARDTIRHFFGAHLGVLVSDRAKVLDFWQMVFRQICWAHLLRKFVAFSERDGPAGAIGRELLGYAALVFEYWHGFQEGKLTRKELEAWLLPVRREVERVLVRAAAADIPRVSGSCLNILEHRDALWTFVTHDGVEPTNNHAERELRAFVLWRKRCFGSKSDRGERFAERMMTVAHTARKQGKALLDFIVRSLESYLARSPAPYLIEA